MLLKGGQKVRFFLDLELAKEIPEGSYLGVEAYALKPSNLGIVPCFPIAVSSVLNTIIFHFCLNKYQMNAEILLIFNCTLYLKDSES